MIFKFYHEVYHPDFLDSGEKNDLYTEVVAGFMKIYRQYDVKMIGMWIDSNDMTEGYTMVAYRDEAHYQEFVAAMRDHEEYQRLSKYFEDNRVSIKGQTLELAPLSPVHIDLNDYQAYIEEARKLMHKDSSHDQAEI